MDKLIHLLSDSQEILTDKVLEYAKRYRFIQYAPSLREAWRRAVAGLSAALIHAAETGSGIPEMGPDTDYVRDEIARFGIGQAKKHRSRGVTLGMFLGLLKYYEQAYCDLIGEGGFPEEESAFFLQFVRRAFDHIEIGAVTEWKAPSERQRLTELQDANREITNEKNKYLTVFESIYDPILLIDRDNRLENINNKAAALFFASDLPGGYYVPPGATREPRWLREELDGFFASGQREALKEKNIQTSRGLKTFLIKYHKMLDISERHKGAVIIFYDITDRKKMEKELKVRNEILEIYASSDPMTGVFNRRMGILLLEEELTLSARKRMPFSVCFFDLDGLKTVNDAYGHAEGDFMIQAFVTAAQACVRERDAVSRMGGDEFLILFPGCREEATARTVAKIEAALDALQSKEEKPFRFSFSFGIVEVDDDRMDANDVIRAADEKMYRNKQSKKQNPAR